MKTEKLKSFFWKVLIYYPVGKKMYKVTNKYTITASTDTVLMSLSLLWACIWISSGKTELNLTRAWEPIKEPFFMCYPYHRQASLTFDREMGFCPSNVELGKTSSTYFKLSIIAEFGLFVPLTKLLI